MAPIPRMDQESPPADRNIARKYTWVSQEATAEVILKFLDHYNQTHYIHLANRAKDLLEEELAKEEWQDVHVNLKCRGKDPKSLEEKLKMRHAESPYHSEEDIWNDIHDLAGVRVVLYMPSENQRAKVKRIVENIWGNDVEPKFHDGADDKVKAEERAKLLHVAEEREKLKTKKKYRKRHLGYIAVHYRLKMKESQSKRDSYSWKPRDKVEIQVVSALSHAWAEAGHDILYKSYAYGPPTLQEELLLDSLNGLVLSGELLLEQFHELVMKRTYTKFKHRDDFGIYLRGLDILQPHEPDAEDERPEFEVEALDVLLRYLTLTGQNYPLAVRNAIKELGFPEDPQLHRIMAEFKPSFLPDNGMLLTICLIRHLLSARSEDPRQNFTPAKQCYIMMNALNLLQTFFGNPEATNRFLREDVKMEDEEREGINWVLDEPCRQPLVESPNSKRYQEKYRTELETAWTWFQKQAKWPHSICGMVFRLAEMGATRDVEMTTLLGQLSIGSIVSRSSTFSNEEDGE